MFLFVVWGVLLRESRVVREPVWCHTCSVKLPMWLWSTKGLGLNGLGLYGLEAMQVCSAPFSSSLVYRAV